MGDVRAAVAQVIELHQQGQPSPYSDLPAKSETTPTSGPAKTRAVDTVETVLAAWANEGPLVHEPTGITRLDDCTGGGLVYGTRCFLLGPPDIAKTMFVAHLTNTWLRAGLSVGVLATDEEASDLFTRFMQQRGFSRNECEIRDPQKLAEMRMHAEELSRLRMYGPTWTIERAAAELDAFARTQGTRAAFFADSVQKCTCDAELAFAGRSTMRDAVTARAEAIRTIATRYRMIALATSEVGRANYGDDGNDLAAAKESGAIEYSARVLLSVHGIDAQPDLVELRIVKNKHGRRDESITLRIDRRLQSVTETDPHERPDVAVLKEEQKRVRDLARCTEAAAALVRVLMARPGLVRREIAPALRIELQGCGSTLAEAAIAFIADAIVKRPGAHNATCLYLDGSRLPAAVLSGLAAEDRARAASYRPPPVAHASEVPDAAE
jgi:hypothetical protein